MSNNKQLRLDVAQLTDVGRKREHNEDNMAYVIPKDQQVMAKKGALFIVADGMGGHAAGEVASEIAVDTVSYMYYQDESDDVSISLLHAIKRANALIHQRAAENMLRSGMGTTCVAAVLRGNMAYIANVGDSRAYLVRKGQVKQVSQDHSWVAEQVRAGLLTEDQARTHAQRNVITRSLGTQADVEIDVFHEQLEEKDSLVLCSDGLSGLVSDDEIQRIVDQSAPQESVYHLVESANANGGPDNITAIVVSVMEVGLEPPHVRHPAFVGGRESGEDTAVLGLPPTTSGVLMPGVHSDNRVPSSPLHYSSGPLPFSESITAPQPISKAARSKRGRLFYTTLVLFLLVLIVLATGGTYFYFHNTTGANTDQTISQSQNLISEARSEVATNPALALSHLATAQSNLRSLQQDGSLTASQHQQVHNLLQGDVATTTQAAIASYNGRSSITSLPCTNTPPVARLNVGTTDTQTKATTVVQVPGKDSILYTLGVENKLYRVENNSLIPVILPAPLNSAKVVDITSNGTQLVLLVAQSSGSGVTNYSLVLLTPGNPKVDTVPLTSPFIKSGLAPTLISAVSPDIYVLLASNSTQNSTTAILDYTPPAKGAHAPAPLVLGLQGTLSFSQIVESMVAFPNHQLFFLSAAGLVQSVTLVNAGNQVATNVLVQKAIAQPLPVSAKDFTWATPVPTVTPGGTNALSIPGTTLSHSLAVGTVNNVSHLYIMDVGLHRVLDLVVADNAAGTSTPTNGAAPASTSTTTVGGGVTGSVMLLLERQYTSSTLFTQVKSIAFDAHSVQVDVVTQNASQMNLISFSTSSQIGCA
ncbi:MAG TPA: Stp1/IreP family PP2C-type Ser/Thr phosphatase [Ktedonobacteraceae bacterium]|nr:Stp1/IreP family PP2C-type Ser/Thr phosphatase [Ktedonobacteraceae bacterium]